MRPLIPLILLALLFPTMTTNALPYLDAGKMEVNATSVALTRNAFAYMIPNGTIFLRENARDRKIGTAEGGRLMSGEGIFVQVDDVLYKVLHEGLEEVDRCRECRFFPFSLERMALIDKSGLLVIFEGHKTRYRIHPSFVRWSDDGNKLVAISDSEVRLIGERGAIWGKDFNTQLLDAEPDDLTYLCMKGCEIYAINGKGFVSWTNRLYGCCTPGKIERIGDLLFVLALGKELMVLNKDTGKVVEKLPIEGYEIDGVDGVVAVRNGRGEVHLLVDLARMRLQSKSLGVLVSWDLPEWVTGSIQLQTPTGSWDLRVGEETFVPIGKEGNITLKVRDQLGNEMKVPVHVESLEVNLSPDGRVEVRGDGELTIEVDGRMYGTMTNVDTGWLPLYTVKVYNYGILVGEYTTYNARFPIVLLALLVVGLIAFKMRANKLEQARSV